jgi:hypothetical protein
MVVVTIPTHLGSVWLFSRDRRDIDSEDKLDKIEKKNETELYLVVMYKIK